MLVGDPARIAALKARLAASRDHCALFDTERFTRNLEQAYRQMWTRWQNGAAPASFDVSGTDTGQASADR